MVKSVRTEDRTLQVNLFDVGMIEIESPRYKGIGVEVSMVDRTTSPATPKDAIYQIRIYRPEPNAKVSSSEYDTVWVMSDGTILHRNERRYKGL